MLGRLRYAQKFVVVGLVLLLPMGLVAGVYVDQQRRVVRLSTDERRGLDFLAPLLNLTGELVESRHRNLTESLQPQLDLAPSLAAVDAADARYGRWLGTTDDWRATRAAVIRAVTSAADPATRFAEFNTAADALLAFVVRVGDASKLILDTDLNTYYLLDTLQFRLPLVLDTAGRAVDRIAVALADPTADRTDAYIDLGLYNGGLASSRSVVAHAVQTFAATTADAGLRSFITSGFADYDQWSDQLSRDLTAAIRDRRLEGFSGTTGENLRAVATSFAADAMTTVRTLLARRIARYETRTHEVELIAGLAGLLAVYLFAGFYLSVTRPIRSIVTTLHAVGEGDLDRRATVLTRDEIGFVARALNTSLAQTKAVTDRLAHQATYDTLTALPNRELALDRLRQALARTDRGGTLLAVCFVDLDRFKIVNDTLGHEAGDEVLCAVAGRMRRMVRAGDTVARLAGDEFVAVCEDIGSIQAAVELGERVVAEVAKPIMTRAGREATVGASVGVCFVAGGHGLDPEDVLRDADLAMYRAKQRGRGRVEVFDEELRASLERRLHLEDDLGVGIAAGQLRVHYQPILNAMAGRLVGFEALVRWQHPERGLLAPDEFIGIAEQTGLILPLGAAVLAEACAQVAAWRTMPGREELRLAVNISAVQLERGSLAGTIAEALAGTGLPPDALWLELSERSILNDVDAVRASLDAVRRLGVHLAIDDVGTGYSSLTHLCRFPVEALKVDRTFVAGLGRDHESEAVVAMILGLARTLGLRGVAEGVEEPGQVARLRELGCTEVQGFLFGRPAPAHEALTSVRYDGVVTGV